MKLITKKQWERLLANGADLEGDHAPVVKLFTPDAGCTWLLTAVEPENHDIAYGLCDLGVGFPELGTVSLRELARVRGSLGLPVERDLFFWGTHPLSAYARLAWKEERISIDERKLDAVMSEDEEGVI